MPEPPPADIKWVPPKAAAQVVEAPSLLPTVAGIGVVALAAIGLSLLK